MPRAEQLTKRLKVQVWILIQEKKKRVLLLQTTVARGMFWQPITGSVEAGETLSEAAERETFEETGMRLGAPVATGITFDFESEYDGKKVQCEETVFYYVIKERPVDLLIDPKEHQVFTWLGHKEVVDCLKYQSNQKAFEKVLKMAYAKP